MANNWTRNETIQAFNLYCKIPFGRIHRRNPDVIALASHLKRTPDAVSYKLANLARLDPALQKRNISGATHGSKMDIEVWKEFHEDWDELSYESAQLLLQDSNQRIDELIDLPEGQSREATVKVRINQQFFRTAVLAAYEFKCCITSLSIPQLLIASHIVPWKDDIKNRTNPRNGLCLNALHDRAFDLGLLTITPKLTVLLSPELEKKSTVLGVGEFFLKYKNEPLNAPSRFAPDRAFLEYHNDTIFRSHS